MIISRQNFNEYIGTLHLAPTQFCHLPGKTLLLSNYPFSLVVSSYKDSQAGVTEKYKA